MGSINTSSGTRGVVGLTVLLLVLLGWWGAQHLGGSAPNAPESGSDASRSDERGHYDRAPSPLPNADSLVRVPYSEAPKSMPSKDVRMIRVLHGELPVASAHVWVTCPPNQGLLPLATDARGLTPCPTDRDPSQALVIAPGFAPAFFEIGVGPVSRGPWVLRLSREAAFHGRVLGRGFTLSEPVELQLKFDSYLPAHAAAAFGPLIHGGITVATGASGEFLLKGLPDDVYGRVRFPEPYGIKVGSRIIQELPLLTSRRHEFELVRLRSITGTVVTPDLVPVQGALLHCPEARLNDPVQSDADGSFHFTTPFHNLPRGATLHVRGPRDRQRARVDLDGIGSGDIDLGQVIIRPLRKLQLTVQDSSESPIAGAWALSKALIPALRTGPTNQLGKMNLWVRYDQDPFVLSLACIGYATKDCPIPAGADSLICVLETASSLTIAVKHSGGQPAAGVCVDLESRKTPLWCGGRWLQEPSEPMSGTSRVINGQFDRDTQSGRLRFVTSSTGSVTLSPLSPGTQVRAKLMDTLGIAHLGSTPWQSIRSGHQSIVLSSKLPLQSLVRTVINAKGHLVPRAVVQLEGPKDLPDATHAGMHVIQQSDRSGSFTFHGLATSPFSLLISKRGVLSQSFGPFRSVDDVPNPIVLSEGFKTIVTLKPTHPYDFAHVYAARPDGIQVCQGSALGQDQFILSALPAGPLKIIAVVDGASWSETLPEGAAAVTITLN